MPSLIVKVPRKQDQVYKIEKDEITIGRGDECDLVLPNISVSRIHAVLKMDDQVGEITDQGSENGMLIAGKKQERHDLKTKDEVMLGHFTLVFLDDDEADYRNQSLMYLGKYKPEALSSDQGTFQMSPQEAAKMLREKSILHNACVMDSHGHKFFPDDGMLTFGGANCEMKVNGLFVFGTVAELSWNGRNHFLQQKAWWIPMTVNRNKVKEHYLRPGDMFEIGNSAFRYKLEE